MTESMPRLLWDLRAAKRQGPVALRRRQAARLADAVAHARRLSPYYRETYAGLPDRVEDVGRLPVTDKSRLMARYDDWATDRAVTLDRAQAFIDDPSLVGTPFLDRYRVGTTSGSSGLRGIFVFDERSTAVTTALALRAFRGWLGPVGAASVLAGGGRLAWVLADGGHFGSSTVLPRTGHGRLRGGRVLRVLSVFAPIADLVAQLNEFRPQVLVGYAGQIALLAGEQAAGRLRISPTLVMLGAEGLPQQDYARIGSVFGARIGNGYGACEFMSTAASCSWGWLHVNEDWVLVEPVDAQHRPTPPGEPSHTVLLTNLANRVQPILRYDLGDSIAVRPDPCPCGNPFTAIRAQGRPSEALSFRDSGGEAVTVAPNALAGVVDRAPGLDLAQVVQVSPTDLAVRVRAARGAEPDQVWRSIEREIAAFLGRYGLDHVTVRRDPAPPQQSAGGKYHLILPYRGGEAVL